jgi:hypothetical protein
MKLPAVVALLHSGFRLCPVATGGIRGRRRRQMRCQLVQQNICVSPCKVSQGINNSKNMEELMEIRKHVIAIGLSLGVLLALMSPVPLRAEGVELGEGVTLTAKVVHVDYVDRELGLLGSDGKVVYVEVGKEARNFDQIQVGDMLNVTYYESVALFIGKGDEKPDASSGTVAARSAKGDMPAGLVIETDDISADVKAIDREKRTVTLELPSGEMVTKKVDPAVKAFDTLQVGDSVNVRYTEALAISVERP